MERASERARAVRGAFYGHDEKLSYGGEEETAAAAAGKKAAAAAVGRGRARERPSDGRLQGG